MADKNVQRARKHLGKTGHPNAFQHDLANFYPVMMHQATRATETIVWRIAQVADALTQNKKQWFLEVQKVARKVCLSSYDVVCWQPVFPLRVTRTSV